MNDVPRFIIVTLVVVIIVSIILQLIALAWILIGRNKLQIVQKETDSSKALFQSLLVDYLFSKKDKDIFNEIQQIATSEFNKKILINEMIDLSVNLSGYAKEKLRALYLKLHLDRDSVAKAHSSKWHIQIKGFRELAFMNIQEVNEKIKHALKSRNNILRMEAQLALVRLNENDPFKFLDDLKRPFTLWEQLNVHELITYHNLPIPDFSQWTKSPNKTVVIFSLRMIHLFKQTHAAQAVIACLRHSDNEVRLMAIKVCGEFNLREVLPHLKQMYRNETHANCFAIIQAMGKMQDESMLEFLKLVLDKEEVQLQIEAALSILKMGKTGAETLEKLMKSEYKNYQIIVKHVLDRRIR